MDKDITSLPWQQIDTPLPFYPFNPVAEVKNDVYRFFIKLPDIFPLYGPGIVTARDHLTIQKTAAGMHEVIKSFSQQDPDRVREFFKLGPDTRDWQVEQAQQDVRDSKAGINHIVPLCAFVAKNKKTFHS
jgi:hypothetical protein